MPDTYLPAGEELRLRTTRGDDLEFVRTAEGAPDARRFVAQWDEGQHEASLDDPDFEHFVMEEAKTQLPVGYLILQGLENRDGSLLLRRMVVTETGEGHGAHALQAVVRHAFEDLDAARLWLEVGADNEAARTLYDRTGFALEGEESGGKLRMAMDRAAYRTSPVGQQAGAEKTPESMGKFGELDTEVERKSTQDPPDRDRGPNQ
jgi:RimJ/RimL family protein N-acetyltransferase